MSHCPHCLVRVRVVLESLRVELVFVFIQQTRNGQSIGSCLLDSSRLRSDASENECARQVTRMTTVQASVDNLTPLWSLYVRVLACADCKNRMASAFFRPVHIHTHECGRSDPSVVPRLACHRCSVEHSVEVHGVLLRM